MAGNRRGKLKEHLEGVHRNFDWIIDHISKCLNLIGDDSQDLSKALGELAKVVIQMDDLAKDLYKML